MILNTNISPRLRDVADKEILTSLFMDDYSLMNGQMGVTLFFALLSRASGNHWYEDFADELLENICNHISFQLPVNFAHGLCGIGWGIEFLISQGFIDNETDDMLTEIDAAIMERDVRRINDMSFETGLQGIYAYVASRILTTHKHTSVPFDSLYLSEIQKKLSENGIDPKIERYSIKTIWNHVLFLFSNSNRIIPWQNAILILEEKLSKSSQSELAVNELQNEYFDRFYISSKDCIFLLINECIGTQYGMGTYIRHHVKYLDSKRYDINVVTLNASEAKFEILNDVAYFNLCSKNIKSSQENIEKSYFYYLANKIGMERKVICHFNLYGNTVLMKLFKEKLSARIVFTVHFTHWGMQFKGDINKMQYLLTLNQNAMSSSEVETYHCYLIEKQTLEKCDKIICPSSNTFKYLMQIYGLPKERLYHVPHIIDSSSSIIHSKETLRRKYGFTDSNKIIIYIGRIDKNKGIFDLIEAIKPLLRTDLQIRLLIIGAGFLNEALNAAIPYWNQIVFMGFQNKQTIDELLSVADLGIVPSHYEEFGYVALEMASRGIPVIANEVGGLIDIANKYSNVSLFSFDQENSLISQIDYYINGPKKFVKNYFAGNNIDSLIDKYRASIVQIYCL